MVVPTLRPYAERWPDAIADVVERAIGAGVVAAADLRTIIVAPTPDWLTIGVWLGVEWDEYPEHAWDEQAGLVPLDAWLDDVDAFAASEEAPPPATWRPYTVTPPVAFADREKDAAWRARMTAFEEDLAAAAQRAALGRLASLGLERPVGVFLGRNAQREPRLVAFCHPEGAPPWPICEDRRAPETYEDAWATLVEDGLVVFHPQDEGSVQTYCFEDMDHVALDEHRDLTVWFRGDPFELTLSPGHNHEKQGGPEAEEVRAALRAHFRGRPGLWSAGEDGLALPRDAATLAARLRECAVRHEEREFQVGDQTELIEALVQRHGVDAVVPLLDAAGLEPALGWEVHGVLAEAFMRQGRAAEALVHLDAFAAGAKRKQAWRVERLTWVRTQALFRLGRHEEAVAASGSDAWSLPYRALSLAELGRREEALALLSTPEAADRSDALAARAVLLARAGQDEPARAALRAAFVGSRPLEPLMELAAAAPALAGVVAEREAWRALRDASAAQAAEAPVVDAPPLPAVAWDMGVPPARVLAPPDATAGTGGEKEAKVSELQAALRVGDRIWAGDVGGAVVELSADGGRRELWRPGGDDIRAELCTVPAGVVAKTSFHLALLGLDGTVLAVASAYGRRDGPLAASGDLVAFAGDREIDLHRAGDRLARVGVLALPERRDVRGLAFAGPSTLVALDYCGLWVADLRDPARPRWRGRMPFPEASDLVAAGDGAIVVVASKQAWVVSFEGERPSGQGTFSLPDLPRIRWEGGALSVFGRSTHQRVSLAERRATECEWLFDADDQELDTPLLVSRDAGAQWAVTKAGFVPLAPLPWSRPAEAIAAEAAAAAERIGPWIRETVQGWLDEPEGEPIGVVRLRWEPGEVRLEAAGPSSLPGAVRAKARRAKLELAERDEAALQEAEDEVEAHEMDRAQRRLALELRELLARSPRAARHVLVLCWDRGYHVVDVVATAGTAPPRRAQLALPGAPSVRERLAATYWMFGVQPLVLRARRDAAVRAEVIALVARESLPGAAHVAEAIADVDPDAVRTAWLTAADRDPAYGVQGLLAFASHPEVRPRLEALCASKDPRVALPARRALGRLEDRAALALVRKLLGRVAKGKEKVPAATLAALSDASLAAVREELAAAHAALAPDPRKWDDADALLLPLVRAGVDALPAGVLAVAAQDREREDGDGLFEAQAPGPASTALRHLVTRRIAAALASGGRRGLWPARIPLEPHANAWHHFFAIAWPAWEAAGLLDEVHGRLAARLGPRTSKSDVQLALHLFLEDVLRADPRAGPLAAALKKAKLPARKLREVTKLARLHRVQFGWALVKQRRYAEARRVADAALGEDPDDGQVLFLDARLAWLERGDPEEALRRIPGALERAEDAVGRGRLYNLHGAALDALGRSAESIPWFEKALAADPSFRASALSNIAEAHWKLGQRDDAIRVARRAAHHGAKTDVVKTILGAERSG